MYVGLRRQGGEVRRNVLEGGAWVCLSGSSRGHGCGAGAQVSPRPLSYAPGAGEGRKRLTQGLGWGTPTWDGTIP